MAGMTRSAQRRSHTSGNLGPKKPLVSLKLSLKIVLDPTLLMIDAGWIGDSQLRIEQYIKEKELLRSAKLLLDKKNGVVKLT